MTAKRSDQPQQHRQPSLEEAFPEPVQLVNSTGGLDEFAPEPERSLLRIEPPVAPTKLKVVPGVTATDVTRVHLPRFDWTRPASRAALVTSVLVVVVAGTLVLRPPDGTPPSAVDPTEPMTDSAPGATSADPPPAAPLATWTAASASPSVEAPAPSEAIPSPRGLAPPASLAGSATTPEPPPRGLVASDAPVGALATSAESTAALAGASSLSIPPAAVATLAPDAATSPVSPPAPGLSPAGAGPRAAASSPAETFRSAATDVPVDTVARPTGRDLDARAIENVLGRYRIAINRLDAGAALAVWPTVNEKTLARAFERLEGQDVSFESCQIEIVAVVAEAACSGSARYVPKVGSRTPKAEARQWTFSLRKASGGWLIDRVEAR